MLLTSSQMWGSGKSWLGNYFLDQLHKRPNICKSLSNEFSRQLVDQLLSSLYVLVDLRQFLGSTSLDMEDWLRLTLVNILVLSENIYVDSTTTKAKIIAQYSKMNLHSASIRWIVQSFISLHRRPIFLHFAEIDRIVQCFQPTVNPVSVDAVRRLYKFWDLLCPSLAITLSIVLGAPHSFMPLESICIAISVAPFQVQGLSACCCLHSSSLISSNSSNTRDGCSLKFKSQEECSAFALRVYFHTNGIPRLVTYTIEYLLSVQPASPSVHTR